MALIAQLPQPLCDNFPCGDADHNGHFEVYGTRTMVSETLVAFEYQGNGQFQRVPLSALVHSVWEFGDGDRDGLMDVIGSVHGGAVDVWESPTPDSFPANKVWSGGSPGSPNYPYPKYMDLDRDGHEEVVLGANNTGICVFENTGDNQYSLVAVLTDSEVQGPAGEFDAGDLDNDSLTELVTGTLGSQFLVFKATGNNQYVLSALCSTETYIDGNATVAHDMDHNGWPEFLGIGGSTGDKKLMVYEATSVGHYHRVWSQSRPDFSAGLLGNPIAVADIDGDGTEEFAVNAGWGVVLFKCIGPHEYSEVWNRESTGSCERLFDINRDGRPELIFDGPRGTEIWEDTEGLAVAEFSKFSQGSPVKVAPSVVRLGTSLQFSDIPPDAAIEVLCLDGRLVRTRQGVRQSTWTWGLRDQAENLVPAGTYFAVIRSKGKSTSLKLCLVK
jgi:hypothetical protein